MAGTSNRQFLVKYWNNTGSTKYTFQVFKEIERRIRFVIGSSSTCCSVCLYSILN